MRCEDYQKLLAESGSTLSGDAARHAQSCPSCRAIEDALSTLRQAPGLSTEVQARLREAAASDLIAVRPPLPEWRRAAQFAAALVLVSTAGIAVLGTAGWRAFSPAARALVALWLAAGIGAQAWLLARLMIPGAPTWKLPNTLPLAAFTSFAVFILPWFRQEVYPRFLPIAGICFAIGIAHAIVARFLVYRLLRAGYLTHPRGVAMMAGSFGAFSGLVVLTVFCAHHDLWHLALGHLSVLAVAPLAAAAAAHWSASRQK